MARRATENNKVEGRTVRASWPLWMFTAAMAGGAFALCRLIATESPTIGHVAHIPWVGLAVGFGLAEAYAFHVHFRGETHTMTLNEIVLVLGLFVVPPFGLLLAQLLGAGFVLVAVKRQPSRKLLFNLAQYAFGTAAAIAVFQHFNHGGDVVSVSTWVATFVACLVAGIVAHVSVTIAIAITERRLEIGAMSRGIALGMIGTLVNTMLGLVVVIVVSQSLLAGALLIGPILVVFVAYRAFLSERSKSAGLQFLYSASEVLSRENDVEHGLVALLEFARDSFHADLAEVVIIGDSGDGGGFGTRSGPGDRNAPLHALEPQSVSAVVDAVGTEAVMVTPEASEPLGVRHGLTVFSAMVAGVGGELGTHGAVFVARGRGSAEPFSKEDLRLFETFANQLETTMEKSRLNTSLAQLQEAKQELAYQAYHDSLTGLANRAMFGERVDDALVRGAATGNKVGVLFIDLDDFKTVNDTMGHAAGDALLFEVARRIASCVGAGDTAARLGGDEFAVLIADMAHEMEPRAVADRILAALAQPVVLEGQPVVMQASIGIATHDGAADASELMQHADVAMYTAKRNGKGRFDEFEPTMSLSVALRHQLKLGLERALERDEFVLHYQPVIDVSSGELSAVEALLRWNAPGRGLLSPTEFVHVAEETGLIVPIGRFVLLEACRQAAGWLALKPDLRVFVNLSTLQIADSDIVADVCAAIAESGLPPAHLQLEVTETAMMHDIDQAVDVLAALKSIGVGIAIDDFGTGFSSLSYVRQLPVDVLKIAKPIVDAICESPSDAAFVRGIVELGHVVGVKVVAEGVEDVDQYAHLVDMGCDYVQGYYYASSMEPVEVAHILARATPVPMAAR